jgi:hypothetical protein
MTTRSGTTTITPLPALMAVIVPVNKPIASSITVFSIIDNRNLWGFNVVVLIF